MFDLLQLMDLGGNLLSYLDGGLDEVVGTAVIWVLEILLTLLPSSPFVLAVAGGSGLPEQSIAWLNWFVDVGAMADLMASWLLCVFLYMVISKVIQIVRAVPEATGLLGGNIIEFITGLVGGGGA